MCDGSRATQKKERTMKFDKFRQSIAADSSCDDFAPIRAARAQIQQINNISDKTRKDYEQKYKRIKSDLDHVDLGALSGTERSFYANRAAFIHGARCELRDLLTERDRATRSGDKTKAGQCFQRIETILKQLEQWKPGNAKIDPKTQATTRQFDKMMGEQVAPTFSELKKTGKTKPSASNSKISDAAKWSKRGINDVWVNLKSGKFKHWAALSIATGIRPEELQRAEILGHGKNSVTVRIHGAKADHEHGQLYRDITLSTAGTDEIADAAKTLAALDVGNVPSPAGKDPREAYRKQLQRLGQRLWPDGPAPLSPYVFRHILAADLKADGADREIIAQVLGHSVTETAAMYGKANTGKKGARNLAVNAEKDVRVNHMPEPKKTPKNDLKTPPAPDSGIDEDGFQW